MYNQLEHVVNIHCQTKWLKILWIQDLIYIYGRRDGHRQVSKSSCGGGCYAIYKMTGRQLHMVDYKEKNLFFQHFSLKLLALCMHSLIVVAWASSGVRLAWGPNIASWLMTEAGFKMHTV